MAVGIFLAPFASKHDDGLEYVGNKLGFLPKDDAPLLPALIPDYEFPGLSQISLKGATAAAGALGTAIVFAVGIGLCLAVARAGRRESLDVRGADSAEEPPHAA